MMQHRKNMFLGALFALLMTLHATRNDEESSNERADSPAQAASDQAQFAYKLQHCLSPSCESLSSQGAATATSSIGRSGDGFTERGSLKFKRSKQRDGYVTIVANNDFSNEDWAKINKLEWYTLRLVCDASSACDPAQPPLFTTIPACWLSNSGYKDQIVLHVNAEGAALGVEYLGEGDATCSPHSVPPASAQGPKKFRTTASIVRPTVTNPLEVVMEEVEVTDSQGNPKPRQQEVGGVVGFLKRYWYIVVPLVLTMLMSPGPAPEGGAAGGQGGGAAAGGASRR